MDNIAAVVNTVKKEGAPLKSF